MNKRVVVYLKTVLDEAYQSAIKKDPDMSMCNIARALEVIESELIARAFEVIESELNSKKENTNGQTEGN